MSVTGGKSQGVYVVTEAEVASGRFRVRPGPAVRVSGLQATTRGVLGGNAVPVYVVSDPTARGVEGGAAVPVSNLTGIRAPLNDLAIPVYVESDDGQFAADAVLRLTWDDNSDNEDGFRIERSTDGVDYVEIDTVEADVATYDDTVTTGATYYYRVRAFNDAGNSDYSNVDSIAI